MQVMNYHHSRFGSQKVLRVDSSARREGSMSRRVADALIERLEVSEGAVDLTARDLAVESPSFVDAAWVDANFTPPEQRNEEQSAALAESDALVAEVKAADVLVIGVPIYNFGVAAKLESTPKTPFRQPSSTAGLWIGTRKSPSVRKGFARNARMEKRKFHVCCMVE